MILKPNIKYFAIFTLLLITEIGIALFLKTGFIRYTFGDFLVVILMYSFFKSFIDIKSITLALAVLGIAFLIEFLQLVNMLSWINLQNNHLARLIFGSTFQISDLIAYTLGMLTFLIIDIKFIAHE